MSPDDAYEPEDAAAEPVSVSPRDALELFGHLCEEEAPTTVS